MDLLKLLTLESTPAICKYCAFILIILISSSNPRSFNWFTSSQLLHAATSTDLWKRRCLPLGEKWNLQVLACHFVMEQACTDFRSVLTPALERALQPGDFPSEIPLLREKSYAQSRADILLSTEHLPCTVSSHTAVSDVPWGKRSRQCKRRLMLCECREEINLFFEKSLCYLLIV